MKRDTTSLQAIADDALDGNEEARGVISYLYGVGCQATHGANVVSFEEAWEALEKARTVLETCQAGMSQNILTACDPKRVNQAKMMMNAADEQVPGAEDRLRAALESALSNYSSDFDLEEVWQQRNHPIRRMQVLSLLATHAVSGC